MSKRYKSHTISGQRIDVAKLQGIFFSSEFTLSDPGRAYNGIKFVVQNDPTCTRAGIGRYEFPVDSLVASHFKRLLQFYENKDDLEICRLIVQETGLGVKGAGAIYDYGGVDDKLLRVVINLRPNLTPPAPTAETSAQEEDEDEPARISTGEHHESATEHSGSKAKRSNRAVAAKQPVKHSITSRTAAAEGSVASWDVVARSHGAPKADMSPVGIRLNIGAAQAWLTTRRSYGVVLAGGLSNISITSGQNIPDSRSGNGHSLYVIMDVKPLRDMRANVADRLCAQQPIKADALVRELKKIATPEEGKGEEVNVLQQLRNLMESNPDGITPSFNAAADSSNSERVDPQSTDCSSGDGLHSNDAAVNDGVIPSGCAEPNIIQ